VRALPKREKQKKKSWKEKQRERKIRQQKAKEVYQIQREREAQQKPRKWPRNKIVFGFCLVAMVFVAYEAWQFNAPASPTNSPSLGLAQSFSLKDVNGTDFSLNQFRGNVIAVHFMTVGCSGLNPINDNQLKQLKSVCNGYCGSRPVTLVTVAVATCATCNLVQIRDDYGITWFLGNDYDDGTLEIVDAYAKYSIQDGAIVLIDKTFNVVAVYNEAMMANALSTRIQQLLGV